MNWAGFRSRIGDAASSDRPRPYGARARVANLKDVGPQAEDETGRLKTFSDGVFAVAITLLVLDLRVPELPANHTPTVLVESLIGLWPKLLNYLISFLVVGSFWSGHHHFFRAVRKLDGRLVWLNMFLLLSVSFLPFPTAVIGTYGNEAVAEYFYAGAMALAGLVWTLLMGYAFRSGLVDHAALTRPPRVYLARGLALPLVAGVVAVIARVSPPNAAYGWWLVAVFYVALGRLALGNTVPAAAPPAKQPASWP